MIGQTHHISLDYISCTLFLSVSMYGGLDGYPCFAGGRRMETCGIACVAWDCMAYTGGSAGTSPLRDMYGDINHCLFGPD